jgi:signal transduction histidine kinase
MALVGLRGKIFLGMVGTMLAVLVPTILVVNYWLSVSVDRKINDDFARARHTFARVHAMSDSLLVWEGRALGRSPRLLAAVGALDAAAVESLLAPEASDAATRDFCAIVGLGGEPFVVGEAAASVSAAPPVRRLLARALLEEAQSGGFVIGSHVYEVAASPVYAGGRVVGGLLVGKRISLGLIESLRGMTGSEVAMRIGEAITLSTLDPPRLASLNARLAAGALPPVAGWDAGGGGADPSAAGRDADARGVADARHAAVAPARTQVATARAAESAIGRLVLAGERHLCASIPMLGLEGRPLGDFLLFQSMDRASGFFDELRRTILGIGVAAGFLAFLFGLFISRGMTKNVRDLVQGVREVERGNYDQPIARRTRDEIGYLAGAFDEMRQSLRERMADTRRLNEDLRAKNVALEETLSKLNRAQQEILKSERLSVTSQLAAQLSHELNNPIYNIQTTMEVLRRRVPQDDKSRQFIDLVYDEALRMGKLTRQMMGFAKPARDEMAPTDLNRVLTELLGISARSLEERGIHVETRLAPELPRVLASPDQLRQVFLNLIANASDAMPVGGRLTIETAADGERVRAVVSDTGCGIAPENLDKIFDAFFTTKSAMSGVGLGLSISYGIVERHKGRIDVASEPGKGARFTVSLPIGAKGAASRSPHGGGERVR